MPASVSVPIASGAAGGRMPHAKSPTCRSLPSIGGPALAICADSTIADHVRRAATSRATSAEIADERRNHVALPARRRRWYAAPRRNRIAAGVDRFLAERAEALALKRRVAVAHFAAREEGLQPVVGRARERHAAQNLAALVGR